MGNLKEVVFWVVVIAKVNEDNNGRDDNIDVLLINSDDEAQARLLLCQRLAEYYEREGVLTFEDLPITQENYETAWDLIETYEKYDVGYGESLAYHTCERKKLWVHG